ncbi:MAG: hypothetical protein Q9159_000364 [Coniocarpon cinnabarinum]
MHNLHKRAKAAEPSLRGIRRMSSTTEEPKLYFGYGSNLWREQMSQRCPQSQHLGVARLPRYRWFIYRRGYANIMETGDASDEVYALVYSLSRDDERRLDRNEGVPWAYQKNLIEVEFWKAEEEGMPVDVGDQSKMERKQMLVYMDENGLIEDEPRNDVLCVDIFQK